MIGRNQLIIDAKDFVRGMSTSSEISDGGFSPETDSVNLIATKGAIRLPASLVDSDTDLRLTGEIIATCGDMTIVSSSSRLAVSNDGKAYRYNGTKLDAAGISLTAAQTWTTGKTDILTFSGEAYISSNASLTRWQNDNTIDAGAAWPFSFTNSTVPHPGIVYENNMYWADKNLLLIQSSVGDAVAPTTVLTLSSDQIIMALGIDPNSGLMLISTSNVLNLSNSLSAVNKLLWYDGNSAKPSKVAIVDDMITSFEPVGGSVFVGYGLNIGYLNGSGVSFLRKLKNVSLDNTQLPYKHHITHIGNTLYVLDGLQVLAFGEVIRGEKVFYYATQNSVNTNKPTALFDVGSNKLGLSFATAKFYTFDTSSVSTASSVAFYTNKYTFPKPIFLRSVYIEYATAVVNNDNNRSIYFQSEDQTTGWLLLIKQGQTSSTSLKNLTGASIYFQDNIIGFYPDKVRSVQFRLILDTVNVGIKRMIIYYDVAE